MRETRVLAYRLSSDSTSLPDYVGGSMTWNVNMYQPETIAVIGEGWEPVSHTVGMVNDDILLTILVTRDTQAPDSL